MQEWVLGIELTSSVLVANPFLPSKLSALSPELPLDFHAGVPLPLWHPTDEKKLGGRKLNRHGEGHLVCDRMTEPKRLLKPGVGDGDGDGQHYPREGQDSERRGRKTPPPKPVSPPVHYKAVLLASPSSTICFCILAPAPDLLPSAPFPTVFFFFSLLPRV